MKTRDFRSDAEVAALVEAFEQKTIPAKEFGHSAHIAVALRYLAESPLVEALPRMRTQVRAFAEYHGLTSLYHETLTTFWMRLLDHVANTFQSDVPLWHRINLIVARWGTRRPVDAHYSAAVINSPVARQTWVPPDLQPLPF